MSDNIHLLRQNDSLGVILVAIDLGVHNLSRCIFGGVFALFVGDMHVTGGDARKSTYEFTLLLGSSAVLCVNDDFR